MMTYATPSRAACRLGVRGGNPDSLSPALVSPAPFLCKEAISFIESEVLQMRCIQLNRSRWQALRQTLTPLLHAISKNRASNAHQLSSLGAASGKAPGPRWAATYKGPPGPSAPDFSISLLLLLLLKPCVPLIISVCSPSRALMENSSQNSSARCLQSPDRAPGHGIWDTRRCSPLPPTYQEVL